MKKLISVGVVLIIVFSLFGCSFTPKVKELSEYDNTNSKELTLLSVKDGYLVIENTDTDLFIFNAEEMSILI